MLSFQDVSVNKRLFQLSAQGKAGEFIHIIGANGSGKSTLLACLAGLLPPDQGNIKYKNQDLADFDHSQLARFRCFQQQQQQSAFSISVRESLAFFAPAQTIPPEVEQALEIEQFMQRPLQQLSGGESRRVQIARALLQIWQEIELGNAVILLDEPIQGLDFRHQQLLFSLLAKLAAKGNLVIASHHDLNLCQQYAHTVWLLKEGRMLKHGTPEQILSDENLQQAFNCGFRVSSDAKGNKLFQTYLD